MTAVVAPGADVAAMMRAIGTAARAAADRLAVAASATKDAALRGGRCGSARPRRGNSCRQPGRLRSPPAQRREPGYPRSACPGRRTHRSHGARARRCHGAARSRGSGDCGLEPPEWTAHRARAHAARRHRGHLRSAAQRHRRCRRAVPQGRQCVDPALRLGELHHLERDHGRAARRLSRRRTAGEPRPSSCPRPTAPPSAKCCAWTTPST